MTATVRAAFEPARTLPNGGPFYSERGVLDFQAEGLAACIERTAPGRDSGHLLVFDPGTGKTVISAAAAAFLFADDEIDLAIVVVESPKIDDWVVEIERFTNLSVRSHVGAKREQKLAKQGVPHVLVTSYETGLRDLVVREHLGTKRKGARLPGPLFQALDLLNKRVLWVFDECFKLKNRNSDLHKGYEFVFRHHAKSNRHSRRLGLTATPLTVDIGDGYNLGRFFAPERMPSIGAFQASYVRGEDLHGHPIYKADAAERFGQQFQAIMTRKRKTDPEVSRFFPRQVEEANHVDLTGEHARFYGTVATLFDPPAGEDDPRTPQQVIDDTNRLFTLLRMTAGHAAAHLHAANPTSQLIARTVGADALRAIGSCKVAPLLDVLRHYAGRGEPVVVFTFYRVVLLELERELTAAGLSHLSFHGGNSRAANGRVKAEFDRGQTQVLLATDAAARGQNLQVARAVVEYESATTHATRTQRINRVHRLLSTWPSVQCLTMVLTDTVETGTLRLALRRNADQDALVGDHGDDLDDGAFVSARERREILAR